MAGWHEITLGDAICVKHGFAFKSQHFSASGEFVVLTPGNFNEEGGFRLRPGKDRFYTGGIPEDYVLDEGDLIVAMTEQGPGLLGSSALIPEGGKYLHNQRLGLIQEIDNKVLDKCFLYYLLNTKPVRGQISGSATGTKVRHTAPERIYRVRAAVPTDVGQQRYIASTLSAYDDLIENNRRRIQLLEQAAQLLYKEWFVNLRFPGHEHVKIKDGVPEGWERKTIGDITKTNQQSYRARELPEEINYIDISSVTRGRITDKSIMHSSEAPGRARRKVKSGDVIWSNVRPNLRAFALILNLEDNDVFSTGFTVLSPVAVPFSYLYLLVTTDEFVSYLVNRATGASYPAVRPNDFERASVLIPSEQVLAPFHKKAELMYEQISALERQIKILVEARNFLLPRLMNGNLQI